MLTRPPPLPQSHSGRKPGGGGIGSGGHTDTERGMPARSPVSERGTVTKRPMHRLLGVCACPQTRLHEGPPNHNTNHTPREGRVRHTSLTHQHSAAAHRGHACRQSGHPACARGMHVAPRPSCCTISKVKLVAWGRCLLRGGPRGRKNRNHSINPLQ